MMKKKLNSVEQKWINMVAEYLPTQSYNITVRQLRTGKQLLAAGQKKQKDGEDVKPDSVYRVKLPKPYPVNHARRMRELLLKQGVQAVCEYAGQFIAEERRNEMERDMLHLYEVLTIKREAHALRSHYGRV